MNKLHLEWNKEKTRTKINSCVPWLSTNYDSLSLWFLLVGLEDNNNAYFRRPYITKCYNVRDVISQISAGSVSMKLWLHLESRRGMFQEELWNRNMAETASCLLISILSFLCCRSLAYSWVNYCPVIVYIQPLWSPNLAMELSYAHEKWAEVWDSGHVYFLTILI